MVDSPKLPSRTGRTVFGNLAHFFIWAGGTHRFKQSGKARHRGSWQTGIGDRVRQRVDRKTPFTDRPAFDEVLLHESRDAVGRHAVVPRAFGVDDQDRTLSADAQALHLRTITLVR